MAKQEKKDIVKTFLPVMDNVIRVKNSLDSGALNIKEGVEIIFREIQNIFTNLGVSKMECKGKDFSPYVHNAVLKEKTTECEPGKILRVIDNGYMLKDEILKPAAVIIAEKEDCGEEKEKPEIGGK